MEERQLIVNAGAVIIKDDKFLLVQEAEDPHKGKWNFPLGSVESDEKIPETVVREAKEETGYDINLTDFLGVYQSLSAPGLNVTIIMFKAEPTGGELSYDEKELLQSKWFSLEEFNALLDKDLFHLEMRNVINRAFNNPRPLDSYVEF